MFFRNKKVENKKQQNNNIRSFIGAKPAPNNRFNVSFSRINQELKQDYIGLVLRSRSLAKNNETVASYLNAATRMALGHQGFIFNATAKNDDGTADRIANEQIEREWNNYNNSYKKYVSSCGTMNGYELDRLVMLTYLIDGEVFIEKIQDEKSPYGVRFRVIDSLDVDMLYNDYSGKNKIVMGIKIDANGKPISYFVRKNTTDYYTAGERVEIPAEKIIHIYRKNFAGQIRGYTPLAPVILALNSIEEYKRAEIDAALLNACFFGLYEKNGIGSAYDEYEDSITPDGSIATEIETNTIKFAPDGYSFKNASVQHPNGNFGNFFKSALKGVCGTLGLSYNKISSDYESTSYSSLRASAIDNAETIKELQQFFISSWKDIEYAEWLKYLLISDLTNLPYSRIEKFMNHTFSGKNLEYIDPVKEMAAIQLRLQLGLSNPLEELKNAGKNPEFILDGWQKWNKMLKDRNLQISINTDVIQNLDDAEKTNEE